MGYYYGIDAIWRTTGVLLGGLSHDIFGEEIFGVMGILFGLLGTR
jgi:hypothetical protein